MVVDQPDTGVRLGDPTRPEDGAEDDPDHSRGESSQVEAGGEVEPTEQAVTDGPDYRDTQDGETADHGHRAEPHQPVQFGADTDQDSRRPRTDEPTLHGRHPPRWRRRGGPSDGEHLTGARDREEHGSDREGVQRAPPRPASDQHDDGPDHGNHGKER